MKRHDQSHYPNYGIQYKRAVVARGYIQVLVASYEAGMNITTTRQAGGLLLPYKGLLPASV